MPQKKPLTKQQKREIRKRKAAQWLASYNGAHVVKAYRKKFNVDTKCALRELKELGFSFTEQEENALLSGQEASLRHARRVQDEALLAAAEEIMLHENTLLDFCEDEQEILEAMNAIGYAPSEKKERRQGVPKNRKGHYCKVCKRRLANECFSGRGHKAHICKACASRMKVERKAKNRMTADGQDG